MLSQIKEKLQAHALETLLATLGTVLPTWLLVTESRLVPYVSQLDTTTVIRLAALSSVLILWLSAILLFFRPRLRFDSRLGVYRDKKTGLYFCPSCQSKKLRAPLKENKEGWRCVIKGCQLFFANPDFKALSEPPIPGESNSCIRI